MDIVEIDQDAGFQLHGHCGEALGDKAIGSIGV